MSKTSEEGEASEDGEGTEEPLVDEHALRVFLEARLPVDDPDPGYHVERHRAGHSNETFFVTWGPHEFVLRRPPRGAFLPTAHDVLREFRVLTALDPFQARTPKPVISCEDTDVIGAPFYLMERAKGQVIRTELPEEWRGDPDAHARIGHELVDALTELHNIEWRETPLETIGKGKGYMERQVERWTDQWERTRPRTDEVRDVPDLDWLAEWLSDGLPETQQITVVHGDYKLDNVVFDGSPPELTGILDWEMATLGDPLADLGWMLGFWRDPGDPTQDILPVEPRFTEQPGFPNRAQLIERYEQATGLEARELEWYVAFNVWKLAILLEGSYARHLSGKTDDPFFELMEHGVPMLASRAKRVALGERPL